MKTYRVLFFISSLKSGGAENHLINLCRFLKGSGHRPGVCTLSFGEDALEETLARDGVVLFRLPLRSLRELILPSTLSLLRRTVRRFHPDIIHAHLYHAEVVSALAGFFSNAPVLATRHSAGLEFGGFRRLAAKWIRPRFNRLITVSEEAAFEAESLGFRRGLLEKIHNAVDTQRFHPLGTAEREAKRHELITRLYPSPVPEHVLVVGSVGGLKVVKNFPLFIRTAARLCRERTERETDPRVLFLIAGEGRERGKLAGLAGELGIISRFALPGHFDRPEDLYPLLDLFVLTSFTEGLPMVLLEAMASGVACVAADVGDIGEVLGDAGVLVKEHAEEAFAVELGSLLADEAGRIELGAAARKRVADRYSIGAWGKRVLDVYGAALRSKAEKL